MYHRAMDDTNLYHQQQLLNFYVCRHGLVQTIVEVKPRSNKGKFLCVIVIVMQFMTGHDVLVL